MFHMKQDSNRTAHRTRLFRVYALAKGRGRAPHKPLLLLTAFDLLEAGQLADGWVCLSPALVVRFQNLWLIVQARRPNKGDIRLPFHSLSGDGAWTVFEKDGHPSRSRATSVRARLDD
jgi:putative restriction endonuclease